VEALLDAFAQCVERDNELQAAVEAASEDPEVAALRSALESRRSRAARKIRALETQVSAGAEAPAVRELGHILLARKTSVPPGVAEIELENFAGEPVTIQLDPRLDAVGNAEVYYERARRFDRAARELPVRIDAARETLTRFTSALAELGESGPSPTLRKLAGLRAVRRGTVSAQPSHATERLPYRVYRTTGGLEVRAGRSARDNDALTFRHSSPDDIWMHVRESPGSHVVLRWNRRDQNPPLRDITEAAVIAAALSQARGSGLVPVSWTRRKYVRKPRKAGPGTVTTQRTQTLFVEPDARLVDRLAVDGDIQPTA
jgi:predicted ribosome quality control (RQC) complex YloA/Tae2 family protein